MLTKTERKIPQKIPTRGCFVSKRVTAVLGQKRLGENELLPHYLATGTLKKIHTP